MRIVAGRNRGRPLTAPPGRAVRPTADRVRESVFNILVHGGGGGAPGVEGARVLDAFAGTGAMGLEALSRDAAFATFMDLDTAACRANVAALGEDARSRLLAADCLRPPPADAPCDLVFLDPPYGSDLAAPALAALTARGWIAPGALCVVELAAKEPLDPPEGFAVLDERRYGAARIVILSRN